MASSKVLVLSVIAALVLPATTNGAGMWDWLSLCRANNDYARLASEKLNRRLAKAINKRDHDESLYLLDAGAKLDQKAENDGFVRQVVNEFLLLEAAQKNDLSSLKAALEKGTNPNVTKPTDPVSTPLMIASFCGYENIASYLVDHGADINAGDSNALYLAIMSEHLEIAERLLENGASIDVKVSGGISSPLMITKSKEAACLLLRHGANPNAIGPRGETPLGSVIDNPEIIKVLLGAGADVGLKMSNGLTIQDYAAKIPNLEVKKIILNHKQYENKTECRPGSKG